MPLMELGELELMPAQVKPLSILHYPQVLYQLRMWIASIQVSTHYFFQPAHPVAQVISIYPVRCITIP